MSRIYEEVDPRFAATCSDVTLCSDLKGFFPGLAEGAVSMASSGWLRDLERVDEGKKVAFVMENEEMMSALTEVFSRIQPLSRGKSTKLSIERRVSAHKALQEGDFTKALALASQTVLKSPMTGEDEVIEGGVSLALSLWLRSEILLRSELSTAALEDLKLALKERLPAKMRAQYYWRMGHCYKGAGEPTRAKVSYELAGRLLGNNEELKAQLNEDIASLDYTIKPKHPPDKKDVSLTGGAKHNIPSLSKLLKISEEETKGRFAVADSPIRTGDVLLVDSPYAACLLSDYYGSHCLHCFRRLVDCTNSAPIWCPKCSGVAFCSVQCRDMAVSSYHSYECPLLDLFIGSGMSILSHIALRMVTQAGLDTSLTIHSKFISNETKTVEGAVLNDVEGVAKKSKMKTRKERLNRSKKSLKNFAEKNLTNEEDDNMQDKMSFEEIVELKAAQIYSLCTHWNERKGEDYLKRIVMARFLTECLKKTDFFKKCEKENVQRAAVSICELLVRNLQLLQFNAHEVFETARGPHLFTGSKPVYVAVGIYPVGALFNHECHPAVSRYFDGRNLVFTATRPLSPGEVVSENYGPHYSVRGVADRQRSLACRYWFRCQCPACVEDWPTLKQMQDGQVYLRCPNMSCPWKYRANPSRLPSRCAKCSVSIDPELVKINLQTVDKCVEEYQNGAKLMEAEKPEEAIRTICDAIDMFYEIARPPHRETHLAQEALRTCLATTGNMYKIAIQQSDAEETSLVSLKEIAN